MGYKDGREGKEKEVFALKRVTQVLMKKDSNGLEGCAVC